MYGCTSYMQEQQVAIALQGVGNTSSETISALVYYCGPRCACLHCQVLSTDIGLTDMT